MLLYFFAFYVILIIEQLERIGQIYFKGGDLYLFIKLDFETDQPIYLQLVEQVIAGVARGHLTPGERLPSVRGLAADIGINMHTVNKAYQELRNREFIQIHRQRGVVIHPDGPPLADKLYVDQLKETLDPLIAESISRQFSREEFLQLCNDIFDDYKDVNENE